MSAQLRPTLDEMAAAAGLGYIETFTRDQLPYVTVYEGDHQYGRGDALIEVVADFGEHPHALLRRALAQAQHARTERQLRAELDRLCPPADLLTPLASVADVASICEHFGITRTEHDPDGDTVWESTGITVLANATGWRAEVDGHVTDVDYGGPAGVLWAAMGAWGVSS